MKVFVLLLFCALSISFAADHQTPFACDRAALSPQARKRHFDELSPALRARNTSIRELADGYEFDFTSDTETVQLLTEWAVGEQVCCRFFDIDLRMEREGGLLSLRLTGRDGVKPFVRAEFARWFKS